MNSHFIGISPAIERIRTLLSLIAETHLQVIICGESGVGKEVVARQLYEKSQRKDKPFVKINCAALPDGLFESELFGFEKGAFTGAVQRKRGKFELANQGVLLLDEIGELRLHLQAKLLHVLQNGAFSPLGSEKEIKTNTWVIAATNKNLEDAVKAGEFREDLFYRLNVVNIYIPPLRERPEDILCLAQYFLKTYAEKMNLCVPPMIPADVKTKLTSYPWPGNIRELQNVIRRFLVENDWGKVLEDLSFTSSSYHDQNVQTVDQQTGQTKFDDFFDISDVNLDSLRSVSLKKIKKAAQQKVEKRVISYVLSQTGWNRSKAVDILNISYKTLLYKIDDLNIQPPEKQRSLDFPSSLLQKS